MNAKPQTIQIFLPGGDPTGIRVAEITTRIVQVIDVPRSLLLTFLKMPESDQVAVYYLVGEADDDTEQQVYIGQTGDLRNRLTVHNKEKSFWQRVLVLISRTNSLTQTHGLFLEWHSLQATRKAKRYADLNGTNGTKPHTPAPMEADCLEIFETGSVLLATLGHPLFDPLIDATAEENSQDVFFCKSGGANGKGVYTPEGFVVLAGSVGRKANVKSITGTSDANFRAKLLSAGVMKIEGDNVVFAKDHLFRSPSTAAVALLGRTANGWLEWKDKGGKTLDVLKRQGTGG